MGCRSSSVFLSIFNLALATIKTVVSRRVADDFSTLHRQRSDIASSNRILRNQELDIQNGRKHFFRFWKAKGHCLAFQKPIPIRSCAGQ